MWGEMGVREDLQACGELGQSFYNIISATWLDLRLIGDNIELFNIGFGLMGLGIILHAYMGFKVEFLNLSLLNRGCPVLLLQYSNHKKKGHYDSSLQL